MGTSRYLDQLGKTIADLCCGQGAEERKVKEGVNRCVVRSKTVFVVAIVDGNLDRHRGVNQANDSGRDSDEVGVPAVCGTGESAGTIRVSSCISRVITIRRLMGECLDIISGKSELLPSNISHKASSNDQYRFLYPLVNTAVCRQKPVRNEKCGEYLAINPEFGH